jgi:L-asparaginase
MLELNVDLISVVSGMDDRFVRCSMQSGARGIVLEGFPGRGAATPAIAAVLPEAIAQGVIVVLATRSLGAAVAPSSGGLAGSATLERLGVIMGGRLSGPKLRLLLMAALGQGGERAGIAEVIEQFGNN